MCSTRGDALVVTGEAGPAGRFRGRSLMPERETGVVSHGSCSPTAWASR
jgi:hypothetical protein